MLLIAELLQQTAVVCNSITASHRAETAGRRAERRYARAGKRSGALANNAREGGSAGCLNSSEVFYLKWTPRPVVFAFGRPPPTDGRVEQRSRPPALLVAAPWAKTGGIHQSLGKQ